MAHDVFISYSSQDKVVADAVCATLESRKIRCWIAPRDVPPGHAWAAALVEAINASRVFVLILSKGSNHSAQVIREVGEAVEKGIPIIPLRIEDVEPTREMGYFIKSLHWLDAMNPPLERHLGRLADSVQALLSTGERPTETAMTAAEAPSQRRWPLPILATILLGLATILILVGVGGWVASRKPAIPPTSSPMALAINPTETASLDPTPSITSSDSDNEWRTLVFNIPNEKLWRQPSEGSYTALVQKEQDTIAWSEEIVEGDLIISLNVASPEKDAECQIVVYGNGAGYSYGNLIFTFGKGYYKLEKHSSYHKGENWLVLNEANVDFRGHVYAATIEVVGDKASLYVDGEKVASTFFSSSEINHSGRIGLSKTWEMLGEVTYSDIKIKTLGNGE